MTIAVCISPADWGSNSKPHTTCATGQGESFSICSSTIDCVSAASLLGNWTTRKKTLSEASQAMFNFGRNSVCQSLPTILAGSGSVGRFGSCRWRANLAENCQSWWTWLPGWSTLQECQRAILSPHQRFGAAVVHQRFEVLFDLGDAQDFLDGRPGGHDLVPTIQAQGSHAMVDGPLRNGRGGGAAQNQRAQRLIQNQNLVDALPALVTQLPALLATHPLPELRRLDVRFRKADLPQVLRLDFPFRAAVRADIAHQTLGHDRLDRRGDQKWLNAHVDQSREGAGRVVRVQRAEDQVPGQRRANGNLRGLQVADFPDHDHVRVLAQDVAQPHRERQPDVRAHCDLVDPLEFILHRLLDGDDSLLHRVDRAQERIKRSGFSRAGGPRDQHDAVWLDDDLADRVFFHRRKTELVQAEKDFAAGQQTERHALAVNRRHRRNANVDLLPLDAHVDAAVLRQTLLRDVHSRHHLDAGDDRGLVTLQLRRHRGLVQNAVNAVADAQFVLRRLEMDVGRAVLKRLPDNLIDEFDDARFLVAFRDLLVLAHEQLDRLVLGQFIEGFRADSVILFERLFDFPARRQRELDRGSGVKLHGIEHPGIERVADDDLQGVVLKIDRERVVLERDLGRDLVARFGRHGELAQIDKRPAQRARQLLQENLLRNAAFPANEFQQRFGRAVARRDLPGLAPLLKLFRSGQLRRGEQLVQ